MKWSFARGLLRTESFFGIMAVILAVSNAPIFQNIGIGNQDRLQRYLVVAFYVLLIFALLALFVARLCFDYFCPEPIRQSGSLAEYLSNMPDNDAEDAQIRSEMAAEWNTANNKQQGKSITAATSYVFLLLFPLSFVVAALSLLEFGLTQSPSPITDQSTLPHSLLDHANGATPEAARVPLSPPVIWKNES